MVDTFIPQTVRADQLRVGDRLVLSDYFREHTAGRYVRVIGVKPSDMHESMLIIEALGCRGVLWRLAYLADEYVVLRDRRESAHGQ